MRGSFIRRMLTVDLESLASLLVLQNLVSYTGILCVIISMWREAWHDKTKNGYMYIGDYAEPYLNVMYVVDQMFPWSKIFQTNVIFLFLCPRYR